MRMESQVTRAARALTMAPKAMVMGVPSQWAREPASRLPIGIMPPKMRAQTPMTRPRISSGTLVWMRVLEVDMNIIMPKEPMARKRRAR